MILLQCGNGHDPTIGRHVPTPEGDNEGEHHAEVRRRYDLCAQRGVVAIAKIFNKCTLLMILLFDILEHIATT